MEPLNEEIGPMNFVNGLGLAIKKQADEITDPDTFHAEAATLTRAIMLEKRRIESCRKYTIALETMYELEDAKVICPSAFFTDIFVDAIRLDVRARKAEELFKSQYVHLADITQKAEVQA